MKNIWNKYKWMLLLLISAFPFVLDVIFYPVGAMVDLYLFLPIFAGLTTLNYLSCQKTIPYIFYQVFILICIICDGYVSTYLYYHNVSNDSMTPTVGMLMTLWGVSISIIVTVVTSVAKAVITKKRTQNCNEQHIE